MLPLGIYVWFGYSILLEKSLELIKQAGFDTTCIWFEYEEMLRDGRADDMPILVRDKGLIPDNIHAPFWNSNLIWSDSQDSMAKIRKEMETSLAFCSRHRIPIMVMHPAGGDSPFLPTPSGLQLIRDLVKQAEDLGVTIAVENLGQGPECLDFIFSNVQSPSLGFCYDSGHDFIDSQIRGKALERWGHLLVTTHLSDNYGINDDHLLPGKGTLDWHGIGKRFSKGGYKGALILEVEEPDAYKDFPPDEYLRTGFQWLRQFERTIG